MSLWKKTKELFKRLKGDDSNTPPPAPAADPLTLPVFIEPLPEYQQRQRDFEARARATTPITDIRGTFRAGRNAAKRRHRARALSLHGLPGGWKKCLRIQDETSRMLAKAVA